MTISQRLTRAGLTLILLGSVSAVLPQQENTAANAGSCMQGSHTFTLSSNSSGSPKSYTYAASTTTPANAASNQGYPFLDSTEVKNLSNPSSYTETISYTNNSTVASGITLTGYNQGGKTGSVAQPGGGTGSLTLTNGNGSAFNFYESASGGNFANFTVTLVYNGKTYVDSASLSG